MKTFIMGTALFLISITFTVFQQDYNLHQQQIHNLKFTAEETTAAAAQYIVEIEYAEGRLVFNQVEGIKAAEYMIKKHLKVDDNFIPEDNSYWQEEITYVIEFFDDSNSTFPFLYEYNSTLFTLTITDPIVVITIDAGKPRYRILVNPPNAIRTAAHEWKSR